MTTEAQGSMTMTNINPLQVSAELPHWRVKSSGVRQVKKIMQGAHWDALQLNGLTRNIVRLFG
jgi:hypothetical protein